MSVKAGLLYQLHETAFHALYADVERAAEAQEKVFVGAPGTIVQHRRGEAYYYARQFLDGDGKQRQTYLAGPVGSQEAEAVVEQMTNRIAEVKALIRTIRELAKLNFSMADAKTYATIGSLFNYGVFNAGGMLIGSHAYGVILNRLGIRAASYRTDDIDIARREQLALIDIPAGGILEILQQTGIRFVEVPQLQRAAPATSFKEAGISRFHVDLLVPSPDESFPIRPVPELKAHAVGLPYLAYLLGTSQTGTLLSRHGAVPVRVPDANRFAIHKLLVSQLRDHASTKVLKDVQQAAVLLACLGEHHPGSIEDACAALPKRARRRTTRALKVLEPLLDPHPAAWNEITEALSA
jgi:hypothetical protein